LKGAAWLSSFLHLLHSYEDDGQGGLLGAAVVFDGDGEACGDFTFGDVGHDYAGATFAVWLEDAGGNGLAAGVLGRDDPEFVGLVGGEREKVGGDED
jgi:hypothetical protein